MAIDFSGVRAKIEHAYAHLQSLHQEVVLHIQGRPYGLRVDHDSEGRRHTAHLDVYREPDKETFALRIGDIAHNLRSALDHAVYAVAREYGGPSVVAKHERDLGFPITRSENAWTQAVARNMLAGVPSSVVAAIQRRQPYLTHSPPETAELSILKTINDLDKHRLPQTVAGYVVPTEIRFTPALPPNNSGRIFPGPYHDGAQIIEVELPEPNPDMDMQMELVMQIRFPNIPVERDVRDLLDLTAQLIQRTIWWMERVAP